MSVLSVPGRLVFALDAHAVEATVDEYHRDREEDLGEARRQRVVLAVLPRKLDGERNGQQSEQRGELDDRVQGHAAGVLEGIANRVADYAGFVQRSARSEEH